MMRKLTEGQKMFVSVMAVFVIYAVVFIFFENYDRNVVQSRNKEMEWHVIIFSGLVMLLLGWLLLRYSKRMDNRISREQAEQQNVMRRQLTQNIAHELKTPVASILGYTETLIDHPDLADDMRMKFVERTHTQAQRLSALLSDMSILNRMDYAPDVLSRERLNVSELMADIVQETQLRFEEKQMTMRNCLPGDIVINGNTSLVYSIFRNLTDNALNYAGEGATVTIVAEEMADRWHFTFSDDGASIPEQHLPRIFERFYRLDKGRSRTLGGTGLGLAIVKNAVQMHGGSITAQTGKGGGLSFEFTLKK